MDLTFKPPITLAQFTRNGKEYRVAVELESYDSEPRCGEVTALVLKVFENYSLVDEIFFSISVDDTGIPFTTSSLPDTSQKLPPVQWELLPFWPIPSPESPVNNQKPVHEEEGKTSDLLLPRE